MPQEVAEGRRRERHTAVADGQSRVDEDVGDHTALLDERRDVEASVAVRHQDEVPVGGQRREERAQHVARTRWRLLAGRRSLHYPAKQCQGLSDRPPHRWAKQRTRQQRNENIHKSGA